MSEVCSGSIRSAMRARSSASPSRLSVRQSTSFSCAPAGFNYQTLYDAAASPAVAITALDADHTMFQDPANCNFCNLCTKGTANPSTVLAFSVRYLTAFFARELLGDKSVGAAFEGAGATADVKADSSRSPLSRPQCPPAQIAKVISRARRRPRLSVMEQRVS